MTRAPPRDATLGSDSHSHPPRHEARRIERGSTIGRYVVLGELGRGGMGAVYAAYDPELDRKVALKILRPGRAPHDTEGRARLLREAQAMAKLTHPNVIAVHDVGEQEGEVYVAMEFVDGQTLDAWARAGKPTWHETVDVYVMAARGLAAAHAKGLVHRDFKPDNVMIGNDGRVRVMDFGLARTTEAVTAPERPGRIAGVLDSGLTRAGAIVGTPAYMSPEQHLGVEAGPLSDQFSFCVAVWEALYGERPFGGETLAALSFQVTQGIVREPKERAHAPGYLRGVLQRGLSAEPEARWPDIDALIFALRRDPARRNRKLAVVAFAALAVAGIVGWKRLSEQRAIAACDSMASAIDAIWNDGTRTTVASAFAATGLSYADQALASSLPWLDAYAEQWRSVRLRTCIAENVTHALPLELATTASECLRERTAGLASLVSVLADADLDAVAGAVTGATALAPVEICGDAEALTRAAAVAPDRGERERTADVRNELRAVSSLIRVARYEDAEAALQSLRADAAQIGWDPLRAEVAVVASELAQRTGDYARARTTAEEGFHQAGSSGHDSIAHELAAQAAAVALDAPGGDADEARLWARLAGMFLARTGEPEGLRHAELAYLEALIRIRAGELHEAVAPSETAVKITERVLGEEHPELARLLTALAIAHWELGDLDEARSIFERALALQRAAFGNDHPDVASLLDNLGSVHLDVGDPKTAWVLLSESLELREKALGPDHPDVAYSLNNLSGVLHLRGEYEEAEAKVLRAIAIMERASGPQHPDVATILDGLGNIYADQGKTDAAEATFDRALRIKEIALGPDHADLVVTLGNLGNLYLDRGDVRVAIETLGRALSLAEASFGTRHPLIAGILSALGEARFAAGEVDSAIQVQREALKIYERTVGTETPEAAYALFSLAEALLAANRPAEAVAAAERCVAIRDEQPVSPDDIGNARFQLARALWAAGADRDRARSLAESSRARLAEAGELYADNVAEVEAWLRRR